MSSMVMKVIEKLVLIVLKMLRKVCYGDWYNRVDNEVPWTLGMCFPQPDSCHSLGWFNTFE